MAAPVMCSRAFLILFCAGVLLQCSDEQPIEGLSASAQRGEIAFKQVCLPCHKMSGGQDAPQLGSLIGRWAGSENFPYSDALLATGFTWTKKVLIDFLTDPRSLIPENQMAFYGINNPEIVLDIVAYIEEYDGKN
ncbi:MAG: cytochrome c family protein [Anaerolineae bacterium]|nr:cytochrome c family protein [Anaerolineae bacterium]